MLPDVGLERLALQSQLCPLLAYKLAKIAQHLGRFRELLQELDANSADEKMLKNRIAFTCGEVLMPVDDRPSRVNCLNDNHKEQP